ncbi:integral membrane protein [Ophiostoma piceae UAMH 11346]|uniref:Integral membrane protein n=1 Tax=Ophiostoma piceae (strain UAMH 11346) TaxID=1262450 RepID=S3DAJ5_OPHP1|nr:integral membrane protein [Ophiostoma piceae UAMH 11346]
MTGSSASVLPGLKGYNPDNLQPWTVGVVASVTVLATVSVIMRLVCRRLNRQTLWWDDYMIIFSLFWYYVVVGFIFAMYDEGMGIHADKLKMPAIVMMAKWLLVAEILYAWNLCWTKISLLLMYYRIFCIPFFKKMAFGIGSFIIAWGITITFIFIFICFPVQKLCVVTASAYRFSVLFSYSNADPSYTLAPTVAWTAIEMSAGITSVCLPSLRPIFVLLTKSMGLKMFNSSYADGRSSAQGATADSHGAALNTNTSRRGNGNGNVGGSAGGVSDSSHSPIQKDAFYRLDDESTEGAPEDELRLRPQHGNKYTVSSWRDSATSVDQIPLHSIRVQTDLKQIHKAQ